VKVAKLLRHPVLWVVLGVGAVAFAVVMYLFQPWRLFTTVEVNEALPVATAPATQEPAADGSASTEPATEPVTEPKVLSQGTFITHEHATSGVAKVLELPDGSRVLRIEDLDTSDGPDLRVWLSDQPVKEGLAGWRVFDDGKYLELGELKGNKGNANYPIPADADLDSLTSVSIWCKRFSVSFGAAALT
jgi:hypothetical protein